VLPLAALVVLDADCLLLGVSTLVRPALLVNRFVD